MSNRQKGKWSKIVACSQAVQMHAKDWQRVKQQTVKNSSVNRSAKQCRERWENVLAKGDQKRQFSSQLQFENGNKWNKIAQELGRKSDNQVKNKFYSLLRKGFRRLMKFMGKKQNITGFVREVRPSVLSQIFNREDHKMRQCILSLAQGSPHELGIKQACLQQLQSRIILFKKNYIQTKSTRPGRKGTRKSQQEKPQKEEHFGFQALDVSSEEMIPQKKNTSDFLRNQSTGEVREKLQNISRFFNNSGISLLANSYFVQKPVASPG